jgi:hypothetical protein
MKIIQIILRIIYYPIGWLGDLFDFIAGALQDIDEKIKMKIVSSEPEENDNEFTMNGANLPGHRNPPPPPSPKTITYKVKCKCGEHIYYYPQKLLLETNNEIELTDESRVISLTCCNGCKKTSDYVFPSDFEKIYFKEI